MKKEFIDFLKDYGVVGLAIAVIIGGKLNLLVTSLVNDVLNPLIFYPVLKATGLGSINDLNYHGVMYGKLAGSLLDFLIVAFLVFIFSKKMIKKEAASKE